MLKPITEHPFGAGGRTVRHYRLDNGLQLLLHVDPSAPILAYQTWFNVGSRHEREGITGIAHLFEHLMFNQTEHLQPGEFDRQLESVGGETNARQTNLDPDDIAPAGYTLANAGAGVGLATGPRVINIDVTLRNAFDKDYQSFLSRYKFASEPIVLDPGRNLTIRVSSDF